jgi:DNA-binding MarR family transcriptional regulator
MHDAEDDDVERIMAQWRRERPDLEPSGMGVFGRISRIAKKNDDVKTAVFAEFGIQRGEFDVLATLRRAGEPYRLNPRQISGSLMVTSGGLTPRLTRLEQAGLVMREADPDDRRGLLVRLTPEGLDLVNRAVEASVSIEHEMLKPFSAEQRERIAELLGLLDRSI